MTDQMSFTPAQRLEGLRRRMVASLTPARTINVTHPAEVAALQTLSPGELREFARSCHANVVPRVASEQFDFTYASWA